MRTLWVFGIFMFAGIYAYPQAASTPPSGELQVLNHTWEKVRINWEGDPLSAPVEGYTEMRLRVATERRPRSALEVRQNQDAKKEEKKPSPPPRYIFSYKVEMVNPSLKTIKEIDWDYVFSDTATGEELGRREFTSTEKIGPGKKKTLIVRVSAPPAQRISVHSLGKNERDGLAEKIEVVDVRYDEPSADKP